MLNTKKNRINPNPVGVTTQTATTASASRSQTLFWYTGASSADGVSNDTGVRAEWDVVKLGGSSFYMKSVWLGMYFTDSQNNQKWTQWGYALHSSLGYINIITTWQFTGGTVQIFPATTFLASSPFVFGQKALFSIHNVPGTTLWRYARNGVDMYEVDLDTETLTRVEFMLESQASSPNIKWPKINMKNFATRESDDTTWTNLVSGGFKGNLYSDSGLSILGIEGSTQNPALADAEINAGGRVPQLLYSGEGTLWSA